MCGEHATHVLTFSIGGQPYKIDACMTCTGAMTMLIGVPSHTDEEAVKAYRERALARAAERRLVGR